MIKENFGGVYPEKVYDRVMWNYLKVMFEPTPEDEEWSKLRYNTVQKWKLFQSCGVHVLDAHGLTIYMLVEKDYPLSWLKNIVHQMINGKIQLQMQKNYWTDDQAYQLLKTYERILKPKEPKQK